MNHSPSALPPLRRLYRPDAITLRDAEYPRDHRILYRLLEERYAKPHSNIKGMAQEDLPSFEDHVHYLESKPYRRLEIVVAGGRDVGLMYLTHDQVGGCFILNEFAGRGLALSACFVFFTGESYPITAHFNAQNRAGYRTADRLGWTLISTEPHRRTYELRQPPLDPFATLERRARSGRGSSLHP